MSTDLNKLSKKIEDKINKKYSSDEDGLPNAISLLALDVVIAVLKEYESSLSSEK